MSLHSVLKDTWYMRLKDKREQRTIEPSRFALGIPAMDKRNDALGSKAHVKAGVNTRDLDLVSMTNGDYINSRIGGHTSTFSRDQLNKILHATPSVPGETEGADEPPVELDAPVEGGVEGGGSSGGGGGGGGRSASDLYLEGNAGFNAKVDSAFAKADKTIAEALTRIKASQAPAGTAVSKPAVYGPVAEAYKSTGSGVTLQPTRNGAELLVGGVNITSVASLTSAPASLSAQLETAREALTDMKAGLEAGPSKKRVESDLAKLRVAINKLVAIKKGNVARKEVGKLREAKYEAEIEGINTGVTKIQALVRGALVRKSAKARDTAEKAMAGILEEVKSKVDKEKALAEVVAEMEKQGASKAKIAKVTKAVMALQQRFRNRRAVPVNTFVATAEEEDEEDEEEEDEEEEDEEEEEEDEEDEEEEEEDETLTEGMKTLMKSPDLTEEEAGSRTKAMRRMAKLVGVATTQKRPGREDYEKKTLGMLVVDIRNRLKYILGDGGIEAFKKTTANLAFRQSHPRMFQFMTRNDLFDRVAQANPGQGINIGQRPGRGRRGFRGGRGGAAGGGGGQ